MHYLRNQVRIFQDCQRRQAQWLIEKGFPETDCFGRLLKCPGVDLIHEYVDALELCRFLFEIIR